jgi:hypothetical protein
MSKRNAGLLYWSRYQVLVTRLLVRFWIGFEMPERMMLAVKNSYFQFGL